MRKIIGIILSITVCLSLFCGCSSPEEIAKKALEKASNATGDLDYDKIIADFVPDHFNTEELSVGERIKHKASVWVENNMSLGKVYSSDTSVITISDTGTVTAVGPGVAYGVISSVGGMYEIIQYTVH